MDVIIKNKPIDYTDSDSSESEWKAPIKPKRETLYEDKDLIKRIDEFLMELRASHERSKPRGKKKHRSSYVKVRMERCDIDTAKSRLRAYVVKYGRIQHLWVDHLTWTNYGHIVFDHPRAAARCKRDVSARYRPISN